MSEKGSKKIHDKWFDKYDSMTVGQILTAAAETDDAGRQAILTHERDNKNRQEIVLPLVNWNS